MELSWYESIFAKMLSYHQLLYYYRVNGWIAQAEHRLLVSAFDVDSEVNLEDSVSRVDSPVRSGSSRHSSRLSSRTSRAASVEAARVKEAARFAELEAEKAMLEKRQVLEERKFRLSQEEVRLKLEVEYLHHLASHLSFPSARSQNT